MASMHCTMFSQVLGRSVPLNVIIPEKSSMNDKGKYPVLYLLHGLMDNCDAWIKNGIEKYSEEYGIAVVMPEGERSFYCDMVYGADYYQHISQEVTQFCEHIFPISTDKENVYIGGNSMGGYGAYKIALKNPDKFSKAASLSGVMNISHMIEMFPEYEKDWITCFGGKEVHPSEDLYFLLEHRQNSLQFFQYCGTEDFLYEDNVAFRQYCIEHNLNVQYSEDGGVHDWCSWTLQLTRLMEWLKNE